MTPKASAVVADKWRPRLALVLATVLLLPLAGLLLLRVYDGALMRQAEAELIAQGAALVAVVSRDAEATLPPDAPLGPSASTSPYAPVEPGLDLTGSVLPPRPDAVAPATPPDLALAAFGARQAPLLAATQRTTLAGFRLLDPDGRVIAGREEVGQSLAHVPEVAAALGGRFAAALWRRVSKHPDPGVASISRGTAVRVFVAMPVIARGRVAGVLYLSRTPSGTLRGLYGQRRALAVGAVSVLAAAAALGLVLHRTINSPVRDLLHLARAVAGGDRQALRPGRRQGTREFADLSRGLVAMAARLVARSDAVSSFAAHVSHELKSPLSAIRGAAELLRDDVDEQAMSAEQRRLFLDNITSDATRLGALLVRLREMALAETGGSAGETAVASLLPALRLRFSTLIIDAAGNTGAVTALSAEVAGIVLSHLCDNAVRHGAHRVDLQAHRQAGRLMLEVRDDGAGISPGNRARVFDAFFTTRRADGGTGMGLAIVRALLSAHGGAITLAETAAGTCFVLDVPLARGSEPIALVPAFCFRPVALAATAAVIAAGLALRAFGPGAGLPYTVTKYGGSILWGAMVYGLVAVTLPRTAPAWRLGGAALVAATIECVRLIGWPALDAFRRTVAGEVLLGRVFSIWNLAAYALGIAAMALVGSARFKRLR